MNVTEEKQRMLGQARKAASVYASLAGKTTELICEDGFTLRIRWSASNFAHLCGLDYFADDNRRRKLPGRRLYVDLLSGARISPKRVAPTGDARWLSRKADVIADAFKLENASAVAESGNSRIRIYLGNEIWCIGLGWDSHANVHYPQSLRKSSLLDESKPGTPIHHIQSSAFIDAS